MTADPRSSAPPDERTAPRCTHPSPLVWRHYKDRTPIPTNGAQEIVMAAFGAPISVNGKTEPPLAAWNGFCPDCGAAVEWSSDKPREARRT